MLVRPLSRPLRSSLKRPFSGLSGGMGSTPPESLSPLIWSLDETGYSATQVGNKYQLTNLGSNSDAVLVHTPCLSVSTATNHFANLGNDAFLSLNDAGFEIEFWCYPETLTGPIVRKDATAGPYQIGLSAGVIYIWISSSASNYIGRYSTATCSANTWVHLKFTYDGTGVASGLKIYKDGVQVDTTDYNAGTYTNVMSVNAAPLTIGEASTGLGGPIIASIADLKLTHTGKTRTFAFQEGGLGNNVYWTDSDGGYGEIADISPSYDILKKQWRKVLCPGHVQDISIVRGGTVGATYGEFIPAIADGSICADGGAVTVGVNKLGNPWSKLNLAALTGRSLPASLGVGGFINATPVNSSFIRNAAAGDDRVVVLPSAATGADLTAMQTYVSRTPTADPALDVGAELAAVYFAEITTQGGTIDSTWQAKVIALLQALNTDGVLNKIKALWLYHGNALNSALLNVVNPYPTVPHSYQGIWQGTPTLDASGGFTAAADAYMKTELHTDGSGFTELTGISFGFYGTSNVAGYPIGVNKCYLAPAEGYAQFGNNFKAGTAQNSTGFHCAVREPNSTNVKAYRNATKWIDTTDAFPAAGLYTASATAYFYVGYLNDPPGYTSTMGFKMAFIGRGLSETDEANFNTAMQAYVA